MKLLIRSGILSILIFASHLILDAQTTPEQVIEDIHQLDDLMRHRHVNPFWKSSPEALQRAVDSAIDAINARQKCDQGCFVELLKIVAVLQDGHSSIAGTSRYQQFGYLPVSVKWFDGELRIVRTAEKYKESLGYRIDKIDAVPVEKVLAELRNVVPHANQSRFHKFVGAYLHLPGLLYGLGISNSPVKTTFSLVDGRGNDFSLEMYDMPPAEEDTTTFVSWMDQQKQLALFQRDEESYYWYDYNQKHNLLYFKYNRVGSMKTNPASAFAQELWSVVDSVEVEKFVLDLRNNGGGSFPYCLPFLQGILDRLDINRWGRLFVITGYDTFSAAITLLNQLELRSQAIVIGETPCDHPASPGDAESYVLDNTGIKINLSSLYHPTIFPQDGRVKFQLDKEIPLRWDEYKRGVDPCLEYIKSFRGTQKTVADVRTYQELQGVFEYSPTRHLRIVEHNNELWVEISHGLSSPLYISSEPMQFLTEIPDVQIGFKNDSLHFVAPDGSLSSHARMDSSSVAPIELFYSSRLEEAKKAYLDLKRAYPDFIELEDHQMSFLATLTYFDLRKYPDVDSTKIALNILKVGIELNKGNAPFCEFSLQFYQ